MGRTIQFALVLQMAGVCLAGQPIGILFDFGTRPEKAVVDLMKLEIRDILAPAQLNIDIEPIGDEAAAQTFSKIVIVKFHGACQTQVDTGGIQWSDPNLLEYPALGRTDISGGRVMPYVQVYCNEVRAFMPTLSRTAFTKLYGRALGRVVAHELYHALLSTRDHSRTGIARVSQSARDLTREKLVLDEYSILRLRKLYGSPKKEGGSEEPPLSEGETEAVLAGELEHQP